MQNTPISFSRQSRPRPFDPPDELKRMREERPISPMRFADGHGGWLVTGYSAVRAILGDARFSARQKLDTRTLIPSASEFISGMGISGPGMLPLLDPPEHTRYRRLLMAEFSTRRMKRLETAIAAITHGCLDAMEAGGPPADLMADFASPIPYLMICELLGIPEEGREELRQAIDTLFGLDTEPKKAEAALTVTLSFFPPLIDARRAEPTDDLFSGLVNGGQLTDGELATIGLLLFASSLHTTANTLSLGTFALLCHPEQMEALRRDPGLVDTAVEELLRYATVGQFGPVRTALEDVEVEGTMIRKGQSVTMSLPTANRDPARFDDPDTLDITRPVGGHVTFGHGFHQCLGQHLARTEMRQAFPALLNRFPDLRLAVPPDEVPTREDLYLNGVHQLPVAW